MTGICACFVLDAIATNYDWRASAGRRGTHRVSRSVWDQRR